jgi:hypothetical protein
MPKNVNSRRAGRSAGIALLLAASAVSAQPTTPGEGLRSHDALLMLEYQTIRVPGDQPIDLMGFHAYQQVLDGVYLGLGFYGPLVKGQYGGFVAADLGVHLRRRLTGPWIGVAGAGVGGGGGGRSIAHSKVLSGSGGFGKAYLGLGHDFGNFTLGASISRLKFREAAIDGTQGNLFLEVPFRYLTGPYAAHGQALPPAEDRLAATQMGETMLTWGLDNYLQIDPRGASKGTVRLADLQFGHFFARDTYWFASLGMAYAGLPLYNQLLGGVGQRWRLSPSNTLYAQLGLGSGGYAPEEIDTDSGLLVYPKLAIEHALTRNLGLAFTVGYMAAPRGSSRNKTYGLALVHHLRSGEDGADPGGATYQGFRASLFHQTHFNLSYREVDRKPLQMLGLQLDVPMGPRWYLPLQAAGAYNAYLGYPGYAEILAGLGLQTAAAAQDRFQAFGQVLGGANVHGRALKLSAGLRYILDERKAVHLVAGHTEARKSDGARFKADTVAFGLDYRFSIPTR